MKTSVMVYYDVDNYYNGNTIDQPNMYNCWVAHTSNVVTNFEQCTKVNTVRHQHVHMTIFMSFCPLANAVKERII